MAPLKLKTLFQSHEPFNSAKLIKMYGIESNHMFLNCTEVQKVANTHFFRMKTPDPNFQKVYT